MYIEIYCIDVLLNCRKMSTKFKLIIYIFVVLGIHSSVKHIFQIFSFSWKDITLYKLRKYLKKIILSKLLHIVWTNSMKYDGCSHWTPCKCSHWNNIYEQSHWNHIYVRSHWNYMGVFIETIVGVLIEIVFENVLTGFLPIIFYF